MNVNIETSSTLRRKMTVELDADEIRRELDRSYNELKRGVHLKGFRPGHAPRPLLERFFGDQVRGEVIQKLIKESTEKALAENNLKPVADPDIVTEESDLKKALRFSATFDVRPELEVKDYQELKVPDAPIEVTDEQIDAELNRMRERSAVLKKVEGRITVHPGDIVLAELEGFENGKPIPDTKMEARTIEASEKSVAHGLHEVLIGAEVGKQKSIHKSYPAEYEQKEIAGKDVEWRGTVKEIFEKQVPLLDDEFAKDQGEYQTLAELRDAVRERLMVRARAEAESRTRQGLVDLIIERNPVEVPESLVEREMRALEARTAMLNQLTGMSREEAIERARERREEFRPQAEKSARTILILDTLADQEKVEVSDDELADRIATIVREDDDRERAASFYRDEHNRAGLLAAMRRERVMDSLMERAKRETPTEEAST